MTDYTQEEIRAAQDQQMNNYLQAVREVIASLEEVRPIVKAWDGKVFNKTFGEAADAGRYLENGEKREVWRHIYKNRRYDSSLNPYIEVRADYICESRRDYRSNNYIEKGVKIALKLEEGKQPRIDATQTVKNIDTEIESLKKEIFDIIQARAGLDTYFQKIEEASKLMSEASAAICGQDCHYGTNIFSKVYGTTYNMSKYRR